MVQDRRQAEQCTGVATEGADAKEPPKIPEEDTEALKGAVGKGNLTKAAAKAKEALERVDKNTLSIAGMGESGSGKLSFVNTIQGLGATDDGAAEIGLTEKIMEPAPLPHPECPNFIVWDLTGTEMANFKSDTYFKQVKFSCYDFFIIISSPHLTYHDISLAQEIQGLEKKFYVVRSKVDQDLTNENRRYDAEGKLKQNNASVKRPHQYSESALLNATRENGIEGLKTGGMAPPPRVFLVLRSGLVQPFRQTRWLPRAPSGWGHLKAPSGEEVEVSWRGMQRELPAITRGGAQGNRSLPQLTLHSASSAEHTAQLSVSSNQRRTPGRGGN
ncbi:LOW QUALITY PROTEIN: interferon-inducible GTPase 1-like [Gopherus evgoodei]|uniref:LOW QUALITY PROTEIN: interferon-inducible GTPase 1-like n=1 Tax=Gopherus evgoodei TaxID=1825980 RepID=UPI0011CF8C42|nr:LOW QUALITY PROTEIN: interferon-inducible GTPase 1-like [Gopherus evgoodei]